MTPIVEQLQERRFDGVNFAIADAKDRDRHHVEGVDPFPAREHIADRCDQAGDGEEHQALAKGLFRQTTPMSLGYLHAFA